MAKKHRLDISVEGYKLEIIRPIALEVFQRPDKIAVFYPCVERVKVESHIHKFIHGKKCTGYLFKPVISSMHSTSKIKMGLKACSNKVNQPEWL